MGAGGWLGRRRLGAGALLGFVLASLVPTRVDAQSMPAPAGGQAPSVGAAGGAPVAGPATPSPQPGSTYVPTPAQLGAASAASPSNAPLGGGNATESSAHPITGDEEDSFDLGPGARGAAGAGVVRGNDQGPIFITGSRVRSGGEPPEAHVVRRGDTLWGVCDQYFQNPYQWPRIWSYNPQIKNPNWIYPGDELRLKSPDETRAATDRPRAASGESSMTLVDRRRTVSNDTIFLRDQGWIRDPSDDTWGEITGAAVDKMFLSDLDEVYLNVKKGRDVRIGQRLTLFRIRQTVAAGAIVQVLGTVRIDDWNERDRVARAQIVEALDVIERGVKIGPVTRSFEIVPPRRNEADVQAHVLASLHPHEFFGQNSVVFIDKGEAAGLRPGNRLFVIRRGDAWRQTLLTADMSFRVSADDERPMPPIERTPGSNHDDRKYPDEIVAELRVVDVKKDTAACLVTQARVEIELRDLVVMRKGY